MKKQISTPDAPKAVGPYSQAVEAGDFVFISGAIPVDPRTNEMKEAVIEVQAKQVFENLSAVLKAAGLTLDDVVKTTVYLSDMENFAAVNQVYASYFCGAVLPARAAVQVGALPKNAMVEVEAVAYRG